MASNEYTIKGKAAVIDALYQELEKVDKNFRTSMLFEGYPGVVDRSHFEAVLPDDAMLSQDGLDRLINAVRNEWKVPQDQHPFIERRGHYAIMKELSARVMQPDTGTAVQPLDSRYQALIRESCLMQLRDHQRGYFANFLDHASEAQLNLLYDAQGRYADPKPVYKDILDGKVADVNGLPAATLKFNNAPTNNSNEPSDKKKADAATVATLVAGGSALVYSLYNLIKGKPQEPTQEGEEPKKQGPGFLTIAGVAVGAVATGFAIHALMKGQSITKSLGFNKG